MSFKPLNLGVLGYGHFIRTNFIKNLRLCPAVNIVGVYNRGEERRKQAESDGYWATSDLDKLLALPGLEAVLIGTANDVHCEHVIASARAGKHILCEKPLALSMKEIDRMLVETDKAGILTHVNHGGPYTEAFEKLQSLMARHCGKVMQVWIRNSRLFGTWKMGARHFAVAHPESSGGWTMHHTCHFINEACVLVDSPATRVYHVTQKSCDEAPSEELVTSIIHFANGATAALSDGTTIGGFSDLGVIGSDGDMRLLGDELTLVTHGEPNPEQRPGNRGQVIQTLTVTEQGKVLTKIGHIFAEAVRNGDGNRLLSFRQIRHEYQIMEALTASARTGKAVDVKMG